jgi:sortase B
MLADKSADYTRKLYKEPSLTPKAAITGTPDITVTPLPDPNRDAQGRLTVFKELLSKNNDTKGWITYPGTNIDYVVMQNKKDPIYYLSHDFNKEKQKAGCLFLDHKSNVESNTKNLVIHGHNMKSSDNMFHYLEHMKKLNYFKSRTTFTFNTIYQTGQWKVFSVFITNGSDKEEPFFDYTQSSFSDSSTFMNFIYQLRIRSIYNLDQVDINENDQICTLSTCTYEINNYRLVIVARKLREGETDTLDKDKISYNTNPLYPQSFYNNYGGKAPKWPKTFEQALKKGLIRWYKVDTNLK